MLQLMKGIIILSFSL